MRTAFFCVMGLATVVTASTAQATVRVAIDLTSQSMHVESRSGSYDWPISSARAGFYTPGGSFAPTHLEAMHFSHKYHMSPMPHAIFFRGGYAIHGTYAVGALGRPASHGCVRLSPGHAAALYAMVKSEGARISISGAPPVSRALIARDEPRERVIPNFTDDNVRQRRRLRRSTYAAYGYSTGETQGYSYGYGYAPAPGYYAMQPYATSPLSLFGE